MTDQGCPSVSQIACAAKQCTVGMQPTHTAGGETPVYFYCSSPCIASVRAVAEWQLELLLSDKHSQHALLCLILR